MSSNAPAETPAALAEARNVNAATAVREDEDEDGDVMMAEEEADQLVSSLQAARHDSNEWVTPADNASIAMLLYGQQVSRQMVFSCQPVEDASSDMYMHYCCRFNLEMQISQWLSSRHCLNASFDQQA